MRYTFIIIFLVKPPPFPAIRFLVAGYSRVK